MKTFEDYIKSYFEITQPQDLETIVSLFAATTIKKGDFLIEAGQRSDRLAFVESGVLRMFMNTAEKEITQWISTDGQFAADLSSFLFDTSSRFSIQALADTEVRMISKADYKRIGDLVPQWHALEKAFILRCFMMIEERIFSHLAMSADERYARFFALNKELFNQVPLQYIASMLGMTPETLSRIRKKQLSTLK